MRMLRQVAFVVFGIVLRWPTWGLLFILGRLGFIQVVFQVYPTAELETSNFCPRFSPLRNFFSARPTLGGFITDGWRPIGAYFVVPDATAALASRKNRHIAENILRRLDWIRRLTAARSVGLAGQLGHIFRGRHNLEITAPFHGSEFGAVFSMVEATRWACSTHGRTPSTARVGILGVGELAELLHGQLLRNGFPAQIIPLRLARGGVRLADETAAAAELPGMDILINLSGTGEQFLGSGCSRYLSRRCMIVDFARPAIPEGLPHTVYRGNRVHRTGTRFLAPLPGGWGARDLPACSLPALLAALSGTSTWRSAEEFARGARQWGFRTALDTDTADLPLPGTVPPVVSPSFLLDPTAPTSPLPRFSG